MKNTRQICTTFVLMFVLATSAFAGNISTPIAEPPPPPPSSATADGNISTGITGQTETGSSEAVDPVTEMALNLLQNVLSLF